VLIKNHHMFRLKFCWRQSVIEPCLNLSIVFSVLTFPWTRRLIQGRFLFCNFYFFATFHDRLKHVKIHSDVLNNEILGQVEDLTCILIVGYIFYYFNSFIVVLTDDPVSSLNRLPEFINRTFIPDSDGFLFFDELIPISNLADSYFPHVGAFVL
jgi:hypothetical protein